MGLIALQQGEGARERWRLELDTWTGKTLRVNFGNESDAHSYAEDFMEAEEKIARIVDAMQKAGTEFALS